MPTIKNQIHIGDLVKLTNSAAHGRENKSNGIVIWRSPTLYTYNKEPLGGFYDVSYYGDHGDTDACACYLYKVYWPGGSETMELGDELNVLP